MATPSFNTSTFNFNEDLQKHDSLPPLMVGFDTETTGLNKEIGKKEKGTSRIITRQDLDEPVSYGLVVYRNGIIQPHEQHHFLVRPTKPSHPMAQAVHGWTEDELDRSYGGEFIKGMAPALHPKIGVNRMAQALAHYAKQGAVIIGANHRGYDMNVLKNTYSKYNNGAPLRTSGFDPDSTRMIDVIRHEQAVTGKPGFVSLEKLCDKYGVDPGGHKALDDARASVDVLRNQAQQVRMDRQR